MLTQRVKRALLRVMTRKYLYRVVWFLSSKKYRATIEPHWVASLSQLGPRPPTCTPHYSLATHLNSISRGQWPFITASLLYVDAAELRFPIKCANKCVPDAPFGGDAPDKSTDARPGRLARRHQRRRSGRDSGGGHPNQWEIQRRCGARGTARTTDGR